jgi:hypothetical protein
MGSKEIKAMDMDRAGDRLRGNPRSFTILDVDIKRADLLALYEGKPTEQALIRAVKQERRALSIASGGAEFLAFVESCRGGIGEDVQFYRLKPDCNGKSWMVIVKGNNRCAALRIVNDDRVRDAQAPFDLTAVQAARACWNSSPWNGSWVSFASRAASASPMALNPSAVCQAVHHASRPLCTAVPKAVAIGSGATLTSPCS